MSSMLPRRSGYLKLPGLAIHNPGGDQSLRIFMQRSLFRLEYLLYFTTTTAAAAAAPIFYITKLSKQLKK